jgi:hypothetical protein
MERGLRQTLSVGGENFEFELCRKQNVPFGPVDVDQWWMEVTPLYAQRQNRKLQSRNHSQVIEHYWAKCHQEHATLEREAQERFLLASLLPLMRSQGSRKVFDDAFLRAGRRADQVLDVLNLDALLRGSREKVLTTEDFYDKSLKLLGRAEWPPELRQKYESLSATLLDKACDSLSRHSNTGAAIEVARVQWDSLMRQFGRRSRCDQEKLVLDVISYESRAAFHHCYSNVWYYGLLPKLKRDYGVNEESLYFMYFWHTIRVIQGQSLFHGHVFGLHPGTARFLLTATGRELMGEWLQDTCNDVSHSRLLYGLFLSLCEYSTRRSESAADRSASNRSSLNAEELLDKKSVADFRRNRKAFLDE